MVLNVHHVWSVWPHGGFSKLNVHRVWGAWPYGGFFLVHEETSRLEVGGVKSLQPAQLRFLVIAGNVILRLPSIGEGLPQYNPNSLTLLHHNWRVLWLTGLAQPIWSRVNFRRLRRWWQTKLVVRVTEHLFPWSRRLDNHCWLWLRRFSPIRLHWEILLWDHVVLGRVHIWISTRFTL